MDFALTQEQRQIRDTVAAFVDAEVVPRAAEKIGRASCRERVCLYV